MDGTVEESGATPRPLHPLPRPHSPLSPPPPTPSSLSASGLNRISWRPEKLKRWPSIESPAFIKYSKHMAKSRCQSQSKLHGTKNNRSNIKPSKQPTEIQSIKKILATAAVSFFFWRNNSRIQFYQRKMKMMRNGSLYKRLVKLTSLNKETMKLKAFEPSRYCAPK